MARLAQIARENDCTHIAWTADARNTRGLSFYARLGAEITEQHGDRCFLRWVPSAADRQSISQGERYANEPTIKRH